MKKLLFVLIILILLLLSCTKEAKKTPFDEIVVPPNEEIGIEALPAETPTEEEPVEYESFEYRITATDYMSMMDLPHEEQVKEFLSVLALGRTDLLSNYLIYATTDEYGKAKFDFKLAKSEEENRWNVKMTVTDSKTKNLPDGEYDYTLITYDNECRVEYFGPTERLGEYLGEKLPDYDTNRQLFYANMLVNDIMSMYVDANVTMDVFDDPYGKYGVYNIDNFEIIYHSVVHTLLRRNEDYIGRATLEEFKDFFKYSFGYTDEELLEKFANELVNAKCVPSVIASVDENGVYEFSCGHGYSPFLFNLTNIESEGSVYKLTYIFYADGSYILPSVKKTFVFKQSENTDILTLIDIENELLSDLEAIRFSP